MGGTDTVMAANGTQYLQRTFRCRPHQEQSSCRSRYSSTIRFNHPIDNISVTDGTVVYTWRRPADNGSN